jgi:N-acetylglucosaminyldiphosphoundecaprenol N-acetyl-beta-D-mannosaminyltransferase
MPSNRLSRWPPPRVANEPITQAPSLPLRETAQSPVKKNCLRPNCIRLLGQRIDRLTRPDILEWVRYFLMAGRPSQIITANPIMLLEAAKDRELARVFEIAALVIAESSGVAWGAWQSGTPLAEFVPGIDLFQQFCKIAGETGKSVFLLGAAPGVAEAAANRLSTINPGLRVAGTHHGFFRRAEEELAVIAQIRESAPDFLFVALNVPHQEKWIARNLEALGVPVVMGVGGSFDVVSGRLRRAPAWMRDMGLEWLFRTLQQPWRIKRVMHLPRFAFKILTAS